MEYAFESISSPKVIEKTQKILEYRMNLVEKNLARDYINDCISTRNISILTILCIATELFDVLRRMIEAGIQPMLMGGENTWDGYNWNDEIFDALYEHIDFSDCNEEDSMTIISSTQDDTGILCIFLQCERYDIIKKSICSKICSEEQIEHLLEYILNNHVFTDNNYKITCDLEKLKEVISKGYVPLENLLLWNAKNGYIEAVAITIDSGADQTICDSDGTFWMDKLSKKQIDELNNQLKKLMPKKGKRMKKYNA